MSHINRRNLLNAFAMSGVSFAAVGVAAALAAPAQAQAPQPAAGSADHPPNLPRFGFGDVVKRASDLAAAPYDAQPAKLPEALTSLDFDAYRDIRFKSEKSPLGPANGPFRLQTFHPGFIFKRTVVVNTIRDGISTPLPYSANLFDYGRNKFDKLPVNLGFAGFRLHYPLNDPHSLDEVISFLGASYFRFLGRDQHYGLSCRALTVSNGGNDEEFPFFREFWVEASEKEPNKATIFALLDGASVTGAFRFDLFPGVESVLEVSATLFPRRSGVKFGLAPLTSMFYLGEDQNKRNDDYRPELHDSDGLLIRTSADEWIWRPLRNARIATTSAFIDHGPRGFGLMQRDRNFDHYQDIDLDYEVRPSYFVEPHGDWGEGAVELLELPTLDETNDNIVAYWTPKVPPEQGKPFSYSYRVRALFDSAELSPNGRVVNSWNARPKALGSNEVLAAGSRRFIVDFAGGDLAFYQHDPKLVELSVSLSQGRVLRSFLTGNPHNSGFRALIDVQADPGQTIDMRAYLKAGARTLTETWTFPWTAE